MGGPHDNEQVVRMAWGGGNGRKCSGCTDTEEIKSTKPPDELEMRNEIRDVKNRIRTTA